MLKTDVAVGLRLALCHDEMSTENSKDVVSSTTFASQPPVAEESDVPVQSNSVPSNPISENEASEQAWIKTYSKLLSTLPHTLSSRLPSTEQARPHVEQIQTQLIKLEQATKSSKESVGTVISTRLNDLKESDTWKKYMESNHEDALDATVDRESWFFKNAWSVTNCTRVAINISLEQIGPLYYEVLLPNQTFERRVPNIPLHLHLTAHTTPDTATTRLSVVVPILLLTGPAVALASLIAIPFVAVAAGGTLLASFVAFGAAATSSVASIAASIAGFSSPASTTGIVGKAAANMARLMALPGAGLVKGKLVEATEKAFGGPVTPYSVGDRCVRYFTKNIDPEKKTKLASLGIITPEQAAEQPDDEGSPRGRPEIREKKRKNFAEVEITGYDLEKVLKCETGKRRVDKALRAAFKKLDIRVKDFSTKGNPVLNITGGPEIEQRGRHTYLIFYHFQVEQILDLAVEPISTTEVPPTEMEKTLMDDARIVTNVDEVGDIVKSLVEEGEKTKLEAEVVDNKSSDEENKDENDVPTKPKEKTEKDAEKPAKRGWLW